MADTDTPAQLVNLATAGTALLTTFRRSGQAVPTPVSIIVDGEHAYFTTAVDSGKAKRIANDRGVTLAPCTTTGDITGPTIAGTARPLQRAERRRLRLLRPTRGLFWSYLLYRLRGRTMRLYEVSLRPPTARRPHEHIDNTG
ncbi:MAG TPA: PPOX class F420-dependent oxidoreductase [Euzebyales bacterium]